MYNNLIYIHLWFFFRIFIFERDDKMTKNLKYIVEFSQLYVYTYYISSEIIFIIKIYKIIFYLIFNS